MPSEQHVVLILQDHDILCLFALAQLSIELTFPCHELHLDAHGLTCQ